MNSFLILRELQFYILKQWSVVTMKTTTKQELMEFHIRSVLELIGEDANREGLLDTPKRVSKMYEEVFSCVGVDPKTALTTTFKEDYDGMVIVKDIAYHTFCEHHLIPFYGRAHIGYIPNGRVVGLSKFARLVDLVSKRPQVQERMTDQIAKAIMDVLDPQGVIVSVIGTHLCMCARGVKKPGSATVTIVKKGIFRNDDTLIREFEQSLLRD
jgi:GTP cyclohydrolase I